MKTIKRFTSYPYMSQDDLNQELWDACCRGDFDQLKYVLHSNELKIHADMYYDNGDCFYWAYREKHRKVVNYLLYEGKYELTEKLKKKCEDMVSFNDSSNLDKVVPQDLYYLFEKRDLYFNLKELPDKTLKKIVKI